MYLVFSLINVFTTVHRILKNKNKQGLQTIQTFQYFKLGWMTWIISQSKAHRPVVNFTKTEVSEKKFKQA